MCCKIFCLLNILFKGFRQVCPPSSIFFKIYMDDNESNIFLKENKPINAVMFVEDLILLSETKKGLQCQIDKLWEYCKKMEALHELKIYI